MKMINTVYFLVACVSLAACGGGGGGGGSVYIDNQGPTYEVVAEAGSSQSGSVGITVVLDGSASSTTGEGPLVYAWTLNTKPAGSATQIENADTENPSLSLDKPGQYVVGLIVTDGGNNSPADSVVITAYAPIANAGPNQQLAAGSTVHLNGSQSYYGGTETLTYNWSIQSAPDGSSAILFDPSIPNPSFESDLVGEYIIGLTVSNGVIVSAEDTVLIQATAPVANAGPDQLVSTGNTVTLDGSASYYGGNGSIFYQWSMISRPDSSTTSLINSTVVNPAFMADVDGEYLLGLVVGNGTVSSSEDTVSIHATTVPVADAGADRTVSTGRTVTLDGSGSSTSNGASLSYQWTLFAKPFNSAATLSDDQASMPVFSADKSGEYVIKLTVNNGSEDSAEDTVTVTAQLPLAVAGADRNVSVAETTVFDASGSSDPETAVLTIDWAITASPDSSSASLSDTSSVTPELTPDVAGDYVISLTVSNDVISSVADEVTVTAYLPIAGAGEDSHVSTGSTVTLNAGGSVDAGGKTLTYQWQMVSKPLNSLSSLSSTTDQQPTFITDQDGDYEFSLVVNNGYVDSVSDSLVINSTTAPVADAGPDQSVSVAETVNLDGTGSSDSHGADLVYIWTLKSIPPGSSAMLSSTTSSAPSFVADVEGDYIAGLVVNNGTENSLENEVTVSASLPLADAGPDYNVALGDTVILDGRNSSDANMYSITYQWSRDNYPIGSIAALSSEVIDTPSFTPDVEGVYDISLVVNNGFADSLPDSMVINSRVSVGNASGIYSTDFEDSGSNSQWSASNGVWEFGLPTSGPGIAYIGSNVVATILDGNYPDHVTSRLQSPSIQLPTLTAGEEIRMRFWHWFNFYPGNANYPSTCNRGSPQDYGLLQMSEEVSVGVWSDWVNLQTFTGYSGSWGALTTDLTQYAGKKIRIGFNDVNPAFTISCTNGTRAGWYLDEFVIEKVVQ